VREVRNPQPVELFVGVIFSDPGLLDPLEAELEARFGDIELRSPVFDFDITAYYEEEMGPDLKRTFFAFMETIDPAEIVEAKVAANSIESAFTQDGRRRVNLDPGYMDFYKVVLASNKFLGQKIYLGKGVYADPTLYYDKGWKPYDWGFPDFKSGQYDVFLAQVRKAYKTTIRNGRGGR
jgi:hypothetical protein